MQAIDLGYAVRVRCVIMWVIAALTGEISEDG